MYDEIGWEQAKSNFQWRGDLSYSMQIREITLPMPASNEQFGKIAAVPPLENVYGIESLLPADAILCFQADTRSKSGAGI